METESAETETRSVEDENFEQAASLRDEIKQMSVRLGNISVS